MPFLPEVLARTLANLESLAPIGVLCWLLAANLVGAVAAVVDKRRARASRSRIPEAALLAIALLGGWLGELLAFLAVRHKTRKLRFLAPFALCALANLAVLAWLLAGRAPWA